MLSVSDLLMFAALHYPPNLLSAKQWWFTYNTPGWGETLLLKQTMDTRGFSPPASFKSRIYVYITALHFSKLPKDYFTWTWFIKRNRISCIFLLFLGKRQLLNGEINWDSLSKKLIAMARKQTWKIMFGQETFPAVLRDAPQVKQNPVVFILCHSVLRLHRLNVRTSGNALVSG